MKEVLAFLGLLLETALIAAGIYFIFVGQIDYAALAMACAALRAAKAGRPDA